MDEKNIPVFDFTDERIFDDWGRTRQYQSLNTKQRKSYKVDDESHDGKIGVEIANIEDKIYKCIYSYRTAEDIYKMIINEEPLNLKGIYVKDFDITEIENYTRYELIDFNACYSFWNGETSFTNVQFAEGNISFDGANFGKDDVSFDGVNFGEGDVSFEFVNFGKGDVSFCGANCSKGYIVFNQAYFGKGDISFDGADFGDSKVSFIRVNFGKGDISFDGVAFGEQAVDFRFANFDKGEISFNRADFGDGEITFSGANFRKGTVDFGYAQFGRGDISFSEVKFGKGDVRYNNVNFGKGIIDFGYAQFKKGNINFNDADFSEADTRFVGTNFGKGHVSLGRTYFGEVGILFKDVTVQNLYFYGTTFYEHVDFRFNSIRSLLIQDCIIEKTLKCNGARYLKLSFLKTVNLGQIYIDWKENNIQAAIENGDVFFPNEDGKIGKRKHTDDELASQFRMLKENFRNIGYYDDEDKAYRTYMKHKNKGFPRNLLKIFNLIGGYGTKPLRVFWTALVVIFGFAGLQLWQNWIGFVDPMRSFGSKFLEAIYFSGVTFFTIGFGDMAPVTGAAGIATVVEGFFGVALMSYFVVALVRKILR